MPTFYAMRARNSGNSAYLSWVVQDAPDTLGAFAPAAIFAGSAQVVNTWEDFFAQAADTFVGRLVGSGVATTQLLSDIDSSSLIYDATSHTFQVAAASGGDITKNQNSNTYTINSNSVTNTQAADMAANTIKANATASTADPADFAVNTNGFVGRLASNIQNLTGTQATTLLDNFTSALKGLAPASGGGTTNFLRADGTWTAPPGTTTAGHVIRVNNTGQTQRAAANFLNTTTITAAGADDAANGETELSFTLGALTGAVTSSANSLTTAFGALAAKSVLANSTNASAVPAALAGSAAFQHLRVNSANTALEWSVLTTGDFPANSVPVTALAQVATDTFLGNITGGTANVTATTLSSLASTSITYDAASHTFRLGAASGGDITRAANSLTYTINNDAVTYAKMQNVSATNRFLGRITAGAGDTEELTGTQATTLLDNFTSALKGLAPASGGGTTNFLRADGTWAAPPDTNTGHLIRNNGTDMTQRAALNVVSSTSLAAVTTDDAASNETEITYQLRAFTGDVTSTANTVALTIANNAVTNAKAADMAANTVKVNNTAGTTDPTDMSVGTNTFVGRLASNIQTLTGTQATTLLDNFTSALKGLAPASGGGTTNFLRADGSWTAPTFSPTELSITETENTSTGAIDGVTKAAGESVYMFSGTAPVLQGIVSANTGVGNPMFIHRQGTGNLEIQDDASATANNRFAMYRDSNILLGDDELAGFVKVDLTAGGTNSPRWLNFTHRAPFANTTDNAVGDTIIHDGLDWKSRPADIRSSSTTVVNSTSTNTCNTITVPANSVVVGSTFEIYSVYSYSRGATNTASTLEVAIRVDGNPAISVNRSTGTTNGSGGNIFLVGILTVRSVGVGGTIAFGGTIDDGITTSFQNTNGTNVLNIDTTASFVINITANFGTAVPSLSSTAQVGYIRRLA